MEEETGQYPVPLAVEADDMHISAGLVQSQEAALGLAGPHSAGWDCLCPQEDLTNNKAATVGKKGRRGPKKRIQDNHRHRPLQVRT